MVQLELASAKLLSLAIWRNKERLTTIPNPLNNTSTKLSGLALATDYNFHLVLKVSIPHHAPPLLRARR